MTKDMKTHKKILLIILIIIGITYLSVSSNCLAAKQQSNQAIFYYKVDVTKPITNIRILPNTYPLLGSQGQKLGMTACRGEYEAATFTVHALRPLKKLEISITDLKSEQSAISAGAINIKVVKCWFQAGIPFNVTNDCVLTPELLLKDDKLVKVDLQEKKNYLRENGILDKASYVLIGGPSSEGIKDIKPRDADVLQPVDLDAGTNKQFWVTVHIPENAVPGQYEGKLRLGASNAPSSEITLKVRVLPFALAKPALRYSIYYRGKLSRYAPDYRASLMKDGQAIINSDWKTTQQYEAEMRDLKAHGVDYPYICQPDEELFRQELEIRRKVGFPPGPLYYSGIMQVATARTPEQIEALKDKVKRCLKLAKQFGYEEVYFYGVDEASGDKLKAQRAIWTAVHQAGGKVFAACYYKAFELSGDLLDLAVLGTGPKPDPKEAEKYHAVGHQVFHRYPHIGVEEPETYRRHVGLQLMLAHYDGAMHYAYQHSYGGHIWNDFDFKPCRDHAFAYPTVDGVIGTIQWEGYRAGVDDVRYLTTLHTVIREAKADKRQLAAAAQEWVDVIDPKGDLDALREKMIDWILKLQ